MKMTFVLLLFMSFYLNGFSQSALVEDKQLVSDVQSAIQKSLKATVKIVPCDVTTKKGIGPAFDGMVINPEGYILSRTHSVNPGQQYLVYFSNGMICTAKGIGAVISQENAILKITGNIGDGLEPEKVVG